MTTRSLASRQQTIQIPGAAAAVRLSSVRHAYREHARTREVLTDASIRIEHGELVILLGRSGSGKSTLLALLGGLTSPDAGTIEVAGRDLTRMSERERTLFRRRSVGFVFQSANLVPTLNVEDNVHLPLELNGALDAAGRARARELLDELGLGDRGRSLPDRLSGGERQRVAIAAALAHDPDLVLADEPTGNLDLATGRDVVNLLDRLTRARGKTLIMATHSPEVMGVADRVLTIRDGALIERDGGGP